MGIMLFLVFAYPVVQGLLLLQGREGVRGVQTHTRIWD